MQKEEANGQERIVAIKIKNLTKNYSDGVNVTRVLKGIDLEVVANNVC